MDPFSFHIKKSLALVLFLVSLTLSFVVKAETVSPSVNKSKADTENKKEENAKESKGQEVEQSESGATTRFGPGVVAPLDLWLQPEEPKKKQITDNPINPIKLKKPQFKPSSIRGGKETLQPKEVAPFTEKEKALRLKLAQDQASVIVTRPKNSENDIRGKVDLVLCFINLNGYHSSARGKSKRTGDSAVAAIEKQNCDLIALQGVASRTHKILWDGIESLALKLNEKTKKPYYGIPGLIGKHYQGSGFIVNRDSIKVRELNAKHAKDIKAVSMFINKPDVLRFYANGQDGGRRDFVVINYDLSVGLGRINNSVVEKQMLMAEFLRGYAVQLRHSFSEDSPVIALLGNRNSSRNAPPAEILSGRIRMSNIGQECSLTKKKDRIVCAVLPSFPQTLFGLYSDTWFYQQETLILNLWGRVSYYIRRPTEKSYLSKLAKHKELFSEIYLFDSDLKMAWKHSRSPGRYKAGANKVNNGLEFSPLVWAELNW